MDSSLPLHPAVIHFPIAAAFFAAAALALAHLRPGARAASLAAAVLLLGVAVAGGLAAFVTGLGVTWLLPAATAVLALLTLITIAQRFTHVRQQLAPRTLAPAPDEAQMAALAEAARQSGFVDIVRV